MKLDYGRILVADLFGPPQSSLHFQEAICEAAHWLYRAQESSVSGDGGVARHYSLRSGWSTSYPETTGYIVPTVLAYGAWRGDTNARTSAKRMLDWLKEIQLPGGGFQGGRVEMQPKTPVVFNTGQILLGLCAGVEALGDQYKDALVSAADWLTGVQDQDGCWRKYESPFAKSGEKAYDTHAAWGLFEAFRVTQDERYRDAAIRNNRWALQHCVEENGWIKKCCLTDERKPLTHTLGYATRGFLEAYLATADEAFLRGGKLTADGTLSALRPKGFLPGRLGPDWSNKARWACLTGSVQFSCCWLILYKITGESRYLEGAVAANQFVRNTIRTHKDGGVRGGVAGSFPIWGDYGRYEFLSWAAKFFIDAHLMELETRGKSPEKNFISSE